MASHFLGGANLDVTRGTLNNGGMAGALSGFFSTFERDRVTLHSQVKNQEWVLRVLLSLATSLTLHQVRQSLNQLTSDLEEHPRY